MRRHLKGDSKQTPFFQELRLYTRPVGVNKAYHHCQRFVTHTVKVRGRFSEADPKLVEVFM